MCNRLVLNHLFKLFKPTSYKRIASRCLYTCANFKLRRVFKIKKHMTRYLCATPVLFTYFLSSSEISKPKMQNIEEAMENLAILIIMAQEALESGDFQRAEAILLLGLNIAEENNLVEAIIIIYNFLANLAYTEGNIDKCEVLLTSAIKRLITAGMSEEDDGVLIFKLKLARIHGNLGLIKEAEQGYLYCIDVQEKKIKNESFHDKTGTLYVDSLFWYGIFLMDNKRYEESLEFIERAYQVTSKMGGLKSSQEIVMLTVLAELTCKLDDYNKAIQYMLKVNIIAKNTGHPELAMSNVLLGLIYLKKEMYDQAKEWCTEGARLSCDDKNSTVHIEANNCLDEVNKALSYKKNNKNSNK